MDAKLATSKWNKKHTTEVSKKRDIDTHQNRNNFVTYLFEKQTGGIALFSMFLVVLYSFVSSSTTNPNPNLFIFIISFKYVHNETDSFNAPKEKEKILFIYLKKNRTLLI